MVSEISIHSISHTQHCSCSSVKAKNCIFRLLWNCSSDFPKKKSLSRKTMADAFLFEVEKLQMFIISWQKKQLFAFSDLVLEMREDKEKFVKFGKFCFR